MVPYIPLSKIKTIQVKTGICYIWVKNTVSQQFLTLYVKFYKALLNIYMIFSFPPSNSLLDQNIFRDNASGVLVFNV